MKTSHILAVIGFVFIGLIFFFSGSTDKSDESQNAPAAVESSEGINTDSQAETPAVTTPADEVAPAAALDTEVSQEPVSQTMPAAESTSHIFTLDSFSYGYSEAELRVKKGDTVTIILTNSGGFHDWVVDEFAAATEKISTGDTTTVTFVADEAGTFEYYCSVGNHRQQGMVGNLIVE
jgi:plastocyanin